MNSQQNLSPELQTLKARYERDGFVFPVYVVPREEMARTCERLQHYLARSDTRPGDDPFLQYKVHMVFPWADRLIRHASVLNAVETLIGPDILVWNTAVLIKAPRSRDFVGWHQDVYYWGNQPDHVVGGWIAIADSAPDNGCVRAIPRSHTWGILHHSEALSDDSMLSRGQSIDAPFDASIAVDMTLEAGEMSLHHTRTVHSSHPNTSDRPRLGLVVTFMSPATIMQGPRTGATLVRGRDDYGHFDLEDTRPAAELAQADIVAHHAAMRPFTSAIYRGAGARSNAGARPAGDRAANKEPRR